MTPEAEPVALADYVRREAAAVEAALVDRDRSDVADAPRGPDAVVAHLFTDAFVAEHTEFPAFDAFLVAAGADSVWALSDWIDWVLDWHVLGNTRFWSWEWMVNAAVELARDAATLGPVRCGVCGGHPAPVTGSSVEEPGRIDETWIRFACDCGAVGRLSAAPSEGNPRTGGDVVVGGTNLPRPAPGDGED